GDVLGDDWAAAFQRAADAFLAAWRSPGALERTTRLPGARCPRAGRSGSTSRRSPCTPGTSRSPPGSRPTSIPWSAPLLWSGAAADAPLYDRLAAFGGRAV
ncbi:MAG: hypothetical protein M3422_19410, partial [Actinomycetota bacterium]|nr:hypothetical protein [Actinomycetota bacterium]